MFYFQYSYMIALQIWYLTLFSIFFHHTYLGTWENCLIELEQTGTPGEVDFGTLSVFGAKKNKVIR